MVLQKINGPAFFLATGAAPLDTATVELVAGSTALLLSARQRRRWEREIHQFNNVTLPCVPHLFSKPYETVLKSDWSIARAGTIFMQNAETSPYRTASSTKSGETAFS